MEQSTLTPFLRRNLDILFVGLNPARDSSRNGHYFSVKPDFWNQLFNSGLIISPAYMANADEVVFGTTSINFRGWAYGITDLVTTVAESDSSIIKPTLRDCEVLRDVIRKYSPRVAILLHGKVLDKFLPFLGYQVPPTNSGELGTLISNCPTFFYNIAFPHGNNIPAASKIARYESVKEYLTRTELAQTANGTTKRRKYG